MRRKKCVVCHGPTPEHFVRFFCSNDCRIEWGKLPKAEADRLHKLWEGSKDPIKFLAPKEFFPHLHVIAGAHQQAVAAHREIAALNREVSAAAAADTLIAMGYRTVSRRHRMIARIDRPDWVKVMAKELLRTPAEFYVPGQKNVSANWCDHYRRCLSKDVRTVSVALAKQIPTSSGDDVGFIPWVEGGEK